jgi:hypothetical protein
MEIGEDPRDRAMMGINMQIPFQGTEFYPLEVRAEQASTEFNDTDNIRDAFSVAHIRVSRSPSKRSPEAQLDFCVSQAFAGKMDTDLLAAHLLPEFCGRTSMG